LTKLKTLVTVKSDTMKATGIPITVVLLKEISALKKQVSDIWTYINGEFFDKMKDVMEDFAKQNGNVTGAEVLKLMAIQQAELLQKLGNGGANLGGGGGGGDGGGDGGGEGGGAPVDPFTHIYNVAGTMNTAWCVPQGWAFKKCTRIVGWDLWMKV